MITVCEHAKDLLPKDSAPTHEEPILVLKPKKKWHYMATGLICLTTVITIIFIVMPVLLSGDYSTVLEDADKRLLRKIIVFYAGVLWCLYTPFWVPFFRKGVCFFYEDRLEVRPFYSRGIVKFYYKEIEAIAYGNARFGNYRLCIHPYPLPSYRSFFQRYKVKTLNGVTLGIIWYALENPECVDAVLRLLKNKASKFTQKQLS